MVKLLLSLINSDSCGRGGTADALDSGSSEGNFMEVQVLWTAPTFSLKSSKTMQCVVIQCGSGGTADAPA